MLSKLHRPKRLDSIGVVLRCDYSVLDCPIPGRDRLSESSGKVVRPLPHEGRDLSFCELLRTGLGSAPVYIARHFVHGIATLLTDRCCRKMYSEPLYCPCSLCHIFLPQEGLPGKCWTGQLRYFGGFNPNFLMGSISNQFSLAFCLLVVGLWVSYCRTRKLRRPLASPSACSLSTSHI